MFLGGGLLGFALALLAGALTSASLPAQNTWLIWSLCAAVSGVVAWRFKALSMALAFLLGSAWFAFAVTNAESKMLNPLCDGQSFTAQFTLAEPLESNQQQQRLLVQTNDQVFEDCFDDLPARIRLSWWQPSANLKPGDHFSASVKLRRPHSSRNPGGFDYVAWLWRKNVNATGYIKALEGHTAKRLASPRDELRQDIERVLAEHPAKPLVLALSIAQRNQLSPELWRAARETGLAHLLAISGLHLGLVAGALFLFGRVLLSRFRFETGAPTWLTLTPMLLGVTFYAYLAGWPLSTQRAWLMLLVFALASLVNWRMPRFYPWAIALLLCLLWQPLNILDAGFYLSFAAVGLLLWFATTKPVSGFSAKALELLKLQGLLLLGMLPLQWWFFGGFSVLALPLNLIVIPIFSFLLLPFLLLVCFGLLLDIGVADQGLLLVAEALYGFQLAMEYCQEASQQTIFAWRQLGQPSVVVIALAALSIALALSPKGLGLRLLAIPAFGALLIAPHNPTPPLEEGEFRILSFDAGQGTAVLIQTLQHNLMYDTGAAWRSGNSAMQTMVLPALASIGVKKLDWVIVSHSDNDHAGGLPTLLAQYPSAKVIGGEAGFCGNGFSIALDGVELRALWPTRGVNGSNDQSCVVRIQSKYGSALLTGDISARVERVLLSDMAKLEAHWLLVPHHGSKTSSSEAFIKAVRPNTAVITSGHGNRYGLPSDEVVQRYQRISPQTALLNTANDGAISSYFGPRCHPCNQSEIEKLRWWQ